MSEESHSSSSFLMLVSIVLCIMPYRADANEKEPMTLFLERVYVDGVVSQEMIKSPSMTKTINEKI